MNMKAFAVAAILAPVLALAQVPQKLSYQGRLLDAQGLPVAGPVNITFKIYPSDTATTPDWTEIQDQVKLTSGFYGVFLGSVTPLPSSLFAQGGEKWLGVTVGNAAEMTPRQRIVSVAYAITAANVSGGTVKATSASVNSPVSGNPSPLDFVGAAYTVNPPSAGQLGQPLANMAPTILNYDVKEFDSSSAVTTTPYWKFTAPIAGFYQVNARSAVIGPNGNFVCFLALYKNGGEIRRGVDRVVTSAISTSLQLNTAVYLAAGDYIDVRLWINSSGSYNIDPAAMYNWISIIRTPGS